MKILRILSIAALLVLPLFSIAGCGSKEVVAPETFEPVPEEDDKATNMSGG